MAVYRIPRGWSERLGDVDGASPPAPIEDAPVADALGNAGELSRRGTGGDLAIRPLGDLAPTWVP